jgi:hypothetical protein
MVELEPKPENFVEFIFGLIKAAYDKKKPLKQMDLQRDVPKKYDVAKKEVQMAIKELVDAGRVVYTYFGGSYLELPHVEGSAKNL